MEKRVRIEYFDQNDGFAALLPRSGELIGKYRDVQGNSDWFLVLLDDPLEYQVKLGEPFRFRLIRADRFLIRSRWAGHAIGGAKPTSVFVLLVADSQTEVAQPFDPASYLHVAWGTCTIEARRTEPESDRQSALDDSCGPTGRACD